MKIPVPTQRRLPTRVDVVLAVYTAGYLALHFAATFQPWDRYLLPILPWVCVLAAGAFVLAWERLGGQSGLQRPLRTVAALLLAPVLLYACWLGTSGRLPTGSDHGAYAGLDQVIATLRQQPADAIIYDRWLGWHYDFYLFDVPQERRWWGSGWKLADDVAHTARAEPKRGQWVVLPNWEKSAAEELHLPLASRGLALIQIRRILRPDHSRSFTLYRIAPSSARGHAMSAAAAPRRPARPAAGVADPRVGDAGDPLAAGPDPSRPGGCGCAHLFHAVLGLSHGRAASRADAAVEPVSIPRCALPGESTGSRALPAPLAPSPGSGPSRR